MNNGFTILEILLVIGIMIGLLAMSFPFMLNIYQQYDVRSESQVIVGLLRTARAHSLNNKFESTFGVNVGSSSYTLFKGSAYDSRDESFDIVIDRSAQVTASGSTEIVFNRFSGRASASQITLSSGEHGLLIDINDSGRINW